MWSFQKKVNDGNRNSARRSRSNRYTASRLKTSCRIDFYAAFPQYSVKSSIGPILWPAALDFDVQRAVAGDMSGEPESRKWRLSEPAAVSCTLLRKASGIGRIFGRAGVL